MRRAVFAMGSGLSEGHAETGEELARLVVGVDLMETVLDTALGEPNAENLRVRNTPEPFGHSRFVIPDQPGRVVRAGAGSGVSPFTGPEPGWSTRPLRARMTTCICRWPTSSRPAAA